jgi:hypothetical protein
VTTTLTPSLLPDDVSTASAFDKKLLDLIFE